MQFLQCKPKSILKSVEFTAQLKQQRSKWSAMFRTYANLLQPGLRLCQVSHVYCLKLSKMLLLFLGNFWQN